MNKLTVQAEGKMKKKSFLLFVILCCITLLVACVFVACNPGSSSQEGGDNSQQPGDDAVYCTVTFNVNGGDSEIEPKDYAVGYVMNLPTPTRDGYTFVGWADIDGTSYTNASIMPNKDLTLYAQWQIIVSSYEDDYVYFKPATQGVKDSDTRYEYSGMTKVRKSPVNLPQDKTFDWKINKDYLFKSSILAVWNKIYKRNFINRHDIKFSNAKLAEDHMFTFKSKILAGKILFIDKPFYNYRVRRDSAVNSVSVETLRVVDILREVTGFFGEHCVCDITGRKNVDFYLEYTLARVFATVPENLKKVYDKKCKSFLNDLQYMEYKKLKFGKYTPLERIFSLKNETSFGIRYKVLVLLGCKLRFRPLQKEIG